MNCLSRIILGATTAALCGCGSGDQEKITNATTACIMDAYHRNHEIQSVENVTISSFGSDKVSADDKSNGIVSVIPFDAKYSILLRAADGKWENDVLHLELVKSASGGRKIRTVPAPDDATYTEQLQRFEPWSCDVPSNG